MNKTRRTSRSVRDRETADDLVVAIVTTVAEAEGTSPLELRPLANVLDPDALCGLCRGGNGTLTVEFDYHGYRVTVSGGGSVTVEPTSSR